MKEIPVEEIPALLASYAKTETFVLNYGKQELDSADPDGDYWSGLSDKSLRTYPGTENPYVLEEYWRASGKDPEKELAKLFKTKVLPDGEIELTYNWWPLSYDFTKENFEASLFPKYLSWVEFDSDRYALDDYFAGTDAHDIFFYTSRAGQPMSENATECLSWFDELTEFWTTYKGKKYTTRIIIHED